MALFCSIRCDTVFAQNVGDSMRCDLNGGPPTCQTIRYDSSQFPTRCEAMPFALTAKRFDSIRLDMTPCIGDCVPLQFCEFGSQATLIDLTHHPMNHVRFLKIPLPSKILHHLRSNQHNNNNNNYYYYYYLLLVTSTYYYYYSTATTTARASTPPTGTAPSSATRGPPAIARSARLLPPAPPCRRLLRTPTMLE